MDRSWSDANGDFFPQEEELGPFSNNLFGTVAPTFRYADDVLRGWGVRGSTWMGSVAFEHQLTDGLAMKVGYYRTSHGNFTVSDNLLVGPEDYDPFIVPASALPDDPRIPQQDVTGLYDISPDKFGQVDTLVRLASDFGDQTEIYNGVDIELSGRFANSFFSGGFSTRQTSFNDCEVRPDSPDVRWCDSTLPWGAQTQVKFNGSHPLPQRFQVAWVYQNLGGIPIQAAHSVSAAVIAESLGRPLSSGTSSLVKGGVKLDHGGGAARSRARR